MTRPDPLGRCDAVGARGFLKELLSGQSARDLRWRLIEKDTGKLERFLIDLASLSHEGYFPVVLVAVVAVVAVAVGAASVVGAEPAGTDAAGVVAETEGPSVAADVDIGDEAGLLLQGSH